MAHAYVLGAVHALILIAFAWCSVSRLVTGAVRRSSAAFVLIWSNLVFTASLLSAISALGSVALYFLTSIAMAAGFDLLLRRRRLRPLPQKELEDPPAARFDRVLSPILIAVLVLAVAGSIAICAYYVPNNWDSCAYRFSRPFFFLARGNMSHFPTGDPRLIFYPTNGALLYLFFAVYEYPARAMYLATWFTWGFAGLGTYSVARSLRASRMGSLIAAWICLMAPNILAQPASTNDEVLAATPILLGISFALDWWKMPSRRLAVLSGLGIGLGFGTKLHWMSYSIAVAAAAAALFYFLRKAPGVRILLADRRPSLLLAAVAFAPLAGGFMISNYLSSGHITDSTFNSLVLNHPFRISLALEKILTNSSHLFLGPIPDLVPPVHRSERVAAYDSFNRLVNKCCLSSVVEARKPQLGGYMFRGPTEPNAFDYTEYTVWLGFLPHLLLLVFAIGVVSRSLPLGCVLFAASFFLWHLTYSFSTIYIGGVGVYYSFPAVIAAGAFGPAWDYTRRSRHWFRHLLLGCFLFVFGANTLLDANLLGFGWLRNLQFLWQSGQVGDRHGVSPQLTEALQSARRVYIPYTHWEVLFWNFMRHNPAARYSTGMKLTSPSPDTLMLVSVAPSLGGNYIPARLPRDTAAALTYMGEADAAPIFASGDHVDAIYPRRTGYVLLPLMRESGSGKNPVRGLEPTDVCCVGLSPSDRVEYRYGVLLSTGGDGLFQGWLQAGSKDKGLYWKPDDPYDVLVIETRSSLHPEDVARTEQPLAGSGYVVGANEQFYKGRRPLMVSVPARVLEPWRESGQDFKVSWLGKETGIVVTNPGERTTATIEMQLATFGKDHTAVLLANGRPVGAEAHVKLFTPVPTAPVIRFPVTVLPGENHFVLTSKESADHLGAGRMVCFLLIGDLTIKVPETPVK